MRKSIFALFFLIITTPILASIIPNYTYDYNGNLQKDGTYYYEYNNFNQLSRIRLGNSTGNVTVEYLYDQNGNRIVKFDKLKNNI